MRRLPDLVADKAPHQGALTSNICPSPLGVKDWEPAAFSPQTSLFYVPTINLCDDLEPLKALYVAGAPFMGADVSIKPGPTGAGGTPHLGELVAWDAAKGEKKWGVQEPLPVYGGVLATAGGLVFYGTLDKHFKALDATTGKVLFDAELECGSVGNPIAFRASDGRDRIAIYSGLGWLAGGFAGGTCATMPSGATKAGGMIHVFKLP